MSTAINLDALSLKQQHEDAIAHKQSDLQNLDARIAEMYFELDEAREEALKLRPDQRTGSATSEVSHLSRTLDGMVRERESLAKDVQTQKQLLEQLEAQANAEQAEAELKAAETEITATEKDVATGWASFVKLAQKLRAEWIPLAAAVQKLDALPGGDLPTSPFPGDLLRAFELALKTEEGTDPFAGLPRVSPRRLAITRTSGVGASDLTGYARDMRSTGEWT